LGHIGTRVCKREIARPAWPGIGRASSDPSGREAAPYHRSHPMPGIITIVIVVLVVLFVLGYFGRGRFRA
jgi:hypothetical protein